MQATPFAASSALSRLQSHRAIRTAIAVTLVSLCAHLEAAAKEYDVIQPHPDVALTADGKWKLHDPERPVPPPAVPLDEQNLLLRGRAPAGAIMLFDGQDLSQWALPAPSWQSVEGTLQIAPQPQRLYSSERFGSVHLHLEWWTSPDSVKTGQDRGNSGVYLMSSYEIQILDTYHNPTYADGYAGALYGMHPPAFDAVRPPGQWQYYDIWFQRPVFDDKGNLVRPARATVDVNGVRVQENQVFDGATSYRKRKGYRAHADQMPLALQDHNEPIRFRNIWAERLPDSEAPPHLVR